ncbi:MAG: toll/interleukin-1 receptor domain-containing protein [Nitrospira sp.]|nr:toll/interleukin-1 receptor domain-containing protein [Nitrospira sp.]
MRTQMKTVFISHASQDKPFVYRLAFELLSEGVPVWLDKWEFGPGDSLVANLDSGLDGSACVLVIESSHAAATKWVSYEVERTLKAEERLSRRLLVPIRIDASGGLSQLNDRVHITLTDGPDFMEGVHALIDHLRAMGFSTEPSGRAILPLLFHRRIEMDTFILDRIFTRWIYSDFKRADIMASTMQLVKNEDYVELQRALRGRISNYMSTEGATAEGLSDLR